MKDKTYKIINIGGTVLFILVALFLLMKDKSDMLFRMQELSAFLFTKDFFFSFLNQPGNMLAYAGSFFTQFFYYPYVGIVLFVLFLLATQQLVYFTCIKNKQFYLLSFIPALLFLLYITRLDYEIYVFHIRDIIYSQLLGFLFSVSILRIYTLFASYRFRIVFLVLAILVGYPLAGFYALAGLLYIAVFEALYTKKYVVSAVVIGLIFLVPYIYYIVFYDHLNVDYIYGYGLPVFEYNSNPIKITGIPVLACSLPILFLIVSRITAEKKNKLFVVCSLAFFALSFGVVFKYTNKDVNFHLQLRMERALALRDWDGMLQIAKETDTPTRSIALYKNIALHRKKTLCDQMFHYPEGSAPIHSDCELGVTIISSVPLFYHYGQLNFSYRWAMEGMVQYGMNVEYLKYMTKIALFNHEESLAKKYIDILSHTMFHKDWAKQYESYVNDRELFEQDPEFRDIFALLQYEETKWGTSDVVEACINDHYANLGSGTRSMLELSMASILTRKSIPLFWKQFPAYIAQYETIPVHVQEAALLYANLENKVDVSSISFDPAIVNRFTQFRKLIVSYGNQSTEETAKYVKPNYGNTFWYYYFFEKNLTTN